MVGCTKPVTSISVDKGNELSVYDQGQPSEVASPFNQEVGRVVFVSYIDGNPEIFLMDGYGGNKERLTENNTFESSPDWAPSGKQIIFLSSNADFKSLELMDLETKSTTQLLKTTEFLEQPIWSPNGEWIVLGKSGELFLISPHLKDEVQLTDFGHLYWSKPLAWSSDCERILFSSNHEVPGHPVSESKLYFFNVREQIIETVTDQQFTYLQSADWSSNEQAIIYSMGLHSSVAYLWNSFNDADIELMSAQPTELLPSRRNEVDVRWLPDGQHIIFSISNHEGNQDVYLLNILTNELVRLTDDATHDSQPVWWSP
jgi:Tol biopolymer transport system component